MNDAYLGLHFLHFPDAGQIELNAVVEFIWFQLREGASEVWRGDESSSDMLPSH
jgi:hypothetical protein